LYVTGASLKNPALPLATEAGCHKEIMLWLRNSGDRAGGRKKRQERKARARQQELAGGEVAAGEVVDEVVDEVVEGE
jgi:hypothetical protein